MFVVDFLAPASDPELGDDAMESFRNFSVEIVMPVRRMDELALTDPVVTVSIFFTSVRMLALDVLLMATSLAFGVALFVICRPDDFNGETFSLLLVTLIVLLSLFAAIRLCRA